MHINRGFINITLEYRSLYDADNDKLHLWLEINDKIHEELESCELDKLDVFAKKIKECIENYK
jgi:hypothetical protein